VRTAACTLTVLVALLAAPPLGAKKKHKQPDFTPNTIRCVGCSTGKPGQTRRNPHGKRDFIRLNPCPSTGKTSGRCPGYVVGYVVPLDRGGADDLTNMVWVNKAEAKAKGRSK
jgi:hypothetical protein